jgi:2-C-methyl-D-erythritol 4-phosphate cytidylyltransferase
MNAAILVAAGKGVRMGADKLWLEIAGRPVIAHTWKNFNDAKCVDEIILVVRDGMQKNFHGTRGKISFSKPFRIVVGGAERQDSVWNGLEGVVAEN